MPKTAGVPQAPAMKISPGIELHQADVHAAGALVPLIAKCRIARAFGGEDDPS